MTGTCSRHGSVDACAGAGSCDPSLPHCPTCGHPLEDDGTCAYAEMDALEGIDHATGKDLP